MMVYGLATLLPLPKIYGVNLPPIQTCLKVNPKDPMGLSFALAIIEIINKLSNPVIYVHPRFESEGMI